MRIACVSDLHLSSEFQGSTGYEWFEEYLAALAEWDDTDHLLVAGDITGTLRNPGETSDLEDFKELLDGYEWLDGKWTTVVPGNHDHRIAGIGPATLSPTGFYKVFEEVHGNSRGPLWHPFYKLFPNVAIIGVDTTAMDWKTVLHEGECGSEQLEELDRILSLRSIRERSGILVMHHPPFREHNLTDADDFWDVVTEGRVDLIVSGHVHESWEDYESGDVPVACVGGFMVDDGESLIIDAGPGKRLSWGWWSPW